MRLLVCVAGMPYAEPAVRLGDVIARITQSPITLLHIASRKGDQATGERFLVQAREILPNQTVETRIRQGDITKEILAEVKEGNYDLVVVGANRAIGLKEHLLGSVTAQIIHRIPTSVLVARQVRPDLERVLICTGGLDVAERVIEAGAWLAKAASAQATLLHVVSPVASMYTGLDEIEETLSALLQTDTPTARHLRHGAEILAQQQVTADLKLRYGVAATEIIRGTHEGDYDLIVIGAAGKSERLKRWILGDVTRQIVESAPRSVLVVKRALVF